VGIASYVVRDWIGLNVPEGELLAESPTVGRLSLIIAVRPAWAAVLKAWPAYEPAMASARDVLISGHTWSSGLLDTSQGPPHLQLIERDSGRREEPGRGELDPGKIATKLFDWERDVKGTSGNCPFTGQWYR
jgi:hypothetical protein